MAMLLPVLLPEVPAVEPLEPAPVELDAPGLLVDPDAPLVVLDPEPMRALVSMNCAPLLRDALDAEPAVPLVPVAPVVPLLPPPCRHPVTVIARLLLDV